MQRRTLLQILSGTAVALFAGVSRAVKVPLLPAMRTVKRGISAMPFVKILERPERLGNGVYVVARMVNDPRREPARLSRARSSAPADWTNTQGVVNAHWIPDVDRTTTLNS